MRNFWTIIRFELLLSWRGPMIWLISLVTALIGIGSSTMVNQVTSGWWSDLCIYLGFLTLLLALTTGNQIHRDRERRLDGIVLSTPPGTTTYVLGKYLAGFFSLFVYASVALFAFVGTSFLLTGDRYYAPPIGLGVYAQVWLMLVLIPTLFAASLTLAGITLMHGQRALVSILVTIFWLVPYAFAVPKLLTISFYIPSSLGYNGKNFIIGDQDFIDSVVKLMAQTLPGHPSYTKQQLVHLYQTVVLSEHMTTSFLSNRAFFLALSILLVIGTIVIVRRQRQGSL